MYSLQYAENLLAITQLLQRAKLLGGGSNLPDRDFQSNQGLSVTASYFYYWGKAKSETEVGPAYHLLPYHCLDVAAVGWHWLALDKSATKQLASQLQVEPEWLKTWFTFCLALHDLGKFARTFQGLRTDLSDDLVKPIQRRALSICHISKRI